MDWGDVPTWLTMVVTALALFAAVRAGQTANKVYEIESGRDAQAADERRERYAAERRAQADKIAAWYVTWNPAPKAALSSDVGGAIVRNWSDLPVFDVTVVFWHIEDDRPPYRSIESRLIRVVPPRDEVKTDDNLFDRNGIIGTVWNGEPYLVSIEFRDAAGVRWSRDIHGKLTELDAA